MIGNAKYKHTVMIDQDINNRTDSLNKFFFMLIKSHKVDLFVTDGAMTVANMITGNMIICNILLIISKYHISLIYPYRHKTNISILVKRKYPNDAIPISSQYFIILVVISLLYEIFNSLCHKNKPIKSIK